MQTIYEFYLDKLNEAGFTPKPADLEKIAASQGTSLACVKLAKAYYEQLQLDSVPYEDEKLRAADAMKLAEAYLAHVEEEQKTAASTADGLLRFLSHAAEGYCAQHQIKLSANDAVKIAGLQAESAEEYEAECAKTASVKLDPETEKKLASHTFPTTAPTVWDPTQVHSLFGWNNPTHMLHDLRGHLPQGAGISEATDLLRNAYHASQNDPTLGFHSALSQVTQPQGGWASRHSGALAAGALGLGALYMMHKKSKDEERARQDRQMSALRAAALPPV